MAGIYRQRHPENTVFCRVFFYYFERRQNILGCQQVEIRKNYERFVTSTKTKFRVAWISKFFFKLGENCDNISFKKGIQFPDLILNTCQR